MLGAGVMGIEIVVVVVGIVLLLLVVHPHQYVTPHCPSPLKH